MKVWWLLDDRYCRLKGLKSDERGMKAMKRMHKYYSIHTGPKEDSIMEYDIEVVTVRSVHTDVYTDTA